MSLRVRFAISIGVMLLPMILSVAISFDAHQNIGVSMQKVVTESVEEAHPVMHLQKAILQAAMPIHDYLIHGDSSERERFARSKQEVDKAFEEALTAPFALAKEKALVQTTWQKWVCARTIGKSLLTIPQPVGDPSAAQEMKSFDTCIDEAADLLDQVHDLAEGEMEQELTQTQAVRQWARLATWIIFGIGLGTALGSAVVLAHSVLQPVRALREGAIHFSEGNLHYRVGLDRRDELGQLARTFNQMADQLEKSQTMLKELAIHDSLTALYNRREFARWLKEEVERSRRFNRPFALLMIDIDHFKRINDLYGHLTGDEVLRVVASLISGEVRSVDTVARYGGEEFVILLPETSEAGSLVTAERICSVIADHSITVDQKESISLTISIGVAVFPEDATSEDELVAAADQALYTAKRTGRNRVCRYS